MASARNRVTRRLDLLETQRSGPAQPEAPAAQPPSSFSASYNSHLREVAKGHTKPSNRPPPDSGQRASSGVTSSSRTVAATDFGSGFPSQSVRRKLPARRQSSQLGRTGLARKKPEAWFRGSQNLSPGRDLYPTEEERRASGLPGADEREGPALMSEKRSGMQQRNAAGSNGTGAACGGKDGKGFQQADGNQGSTRADANHHDKQGWFRGEQAANRDSQTNPSPGPKGMRGSGGALDATITGGGSKHDWFRGATGFASLQTDSNDTSARKTKLRTAGASRPNAAHAKKHQMTPVQQHMFACAARGRTERLAELVQQHAAEAANSINGIGQTLEMVRQLLTTLSDCCLHC